MKNCVIGQRIRAALATFVLIPSFLFASPSFATTVRGSFDPAGFDELISSAIDRHAGVRWPEWRYGDPAAHPAQKVLAAVTADKGAWDKFDLRAIRSDAAWLQIQKAWARGFDPEGRELHMLGGRFERSVLEFFAGRLPEYLRHRNRGDFSPPQDIQAVPVPPAALLFGSALALLGRMRATRESDLRR